MANRLSSTRKQIRGFVLIWTAITFIMSTATFFAIYFTYSPTASPLSNLGSRSVAFPSPTAGGESAKVIIPSVTPQPSATPAPTQTSEASAQQVVSISTETPTSEPSPTPTLRPVDDQRFQVGIQVQFSLDFNPDNQDGWYRSVRQDLGLRWVKQQVAWELVEPERGQFDWSILDFVMPSAQRNDIKMMLAIVAAPDWAREPGVNLDKHGPPANNQDLANFVTAILQRYPGQVHAVEVWNEQNLDREWTSTRGLSAVNYVALLRDVYNAVKAVDPGVIVISGALSPTGIDDGVGAIDDFRYMELMINAGMLEVADCVGAHHNGINVGPSYKYNEIPNDPTALFRGPFDNPHHSWSFRSTLEGYATRIRNAGSDKKLCVTEFGWAVAEDLEGYPPGFEFAADNTLAEQAQWIPEAMTNMEQWGFVWLAFIWNFNYGPQAGYNPNNDNVPYSLIGPGFTFRPAYDAIREWQRDYLARTGQS